MNKTEYKDGGNIIDFNPNHVPSKRIINYAKSIKQKHPKIWDLGGNIFGNEAFDNLERVSKRGYWLESEEWMYIKWRSYVARHQHDFRINGVIAMLKWADIVNKGWAYMKDLIEAKIEKTTKMKKGGELKILAPNGEPSNLTPEQYKLVRTESFKRWFGDWENDPKNASKVVDENGEPLVVYHGTKNEFYEFDTNKQLKGWLGRGFYFSKNKVVAKDYGKRLLKCFLNIKNPFIIQADVVNTDGTISWGLGREGEIAQKYGYVNSDDISITLKEFKNDGIIEADMISCFKANQIKLADGTNTNFDELNDDIRFENGGIYNISNSSRFKPFETIYFEPPFVGKNGNKLVSYTWKYDYTIGEKNGEFYDKRVSDWTQAEISADTGKNIVHAFTILKTNGENEAVSSESVPYLLGLLDKEDKKTFSNIANASKNLAQQQMKLSIIESQLREYEDAEKRIIENGFPSIKLVESKYGLENITLVMGDVKTESDADNPYQDYRVQLLKDKYVKEELNKLGISFDKSLMNKEIFDLKKRIELQKNKLNSQIAVNKMGQGGNLDKQDSVTMDKLTTKKDADSNWVGKYLDLDFKLFNTKEGWSYSIYYFSPMWQSNNIYSSDIDFFPFKTKKLAIASVIEEIKEIKEKNDAFLKTRMKQGGNIDKQDSVTMDIPLLIRTLELARENVKSDAELHHIVENLLKLKNKKVLTMDDYEYIAKVKNKHIYKMENGGKITEEEIMNNQAGGVLIGKDRDGQTIIPEDGSMGGFLVGKLHKDGGIQAVNKSNGQPIEMQGNEVVITSPAVADTTKKEFEGKMMTNREILSKINSDGGGVEFAKGGSVSNNSSKVSLATTNKIKKLSKRILEIFRLNLGNEGDFYFYKGNLSIKERAKLIKEQIKLENELTEITDKLSQTQCSSIDSEEFQALNTAGDYGYEDEYADGGELNGSVISNWKNVPTIYKNIGKVKKVEFQNTPNDKGLLNIIAPFLGKDDLRPVFGCINFDDNGITVTDAHKLIVLPFPYPEFNGVYEVINSKKQKKDPQLSTDLVFPNYKAVIRKYSDNKIQLQFSIYKLLQYTKVALNYVDKTIYTINFKVEDKLISINGKFLEQILTAMLKLGHVKMFINIEEPNNSLIFSERKNYYLGNDYLYLLMPSRIDGENYGAYNIDDDKSLSVYYDFTDDSIHNADGSIAEFKFEYENNSKVDVNYINLLSKFTNYRNNVLNILNFAKAKNGLLTATNLETTISVKNVGLENGLYSISNKALQISKKEDIEDYPIIPLFDTDESYSKNDKWFEKKLYDHDKDENSIKTAFEFEIASDVFNLYIQKLVLSKGDDDLRPVMSGLLIEKTSENEIYMVSTDAHTMFKINLTDLCKFKKDDRELKYIITTTYLKDFTNLTNGLLTIKCNKTNIFIESEELQYIARTIDGVYPNYNAVIPYTTTNELTFNIAELKNLVKSPKVTQLLAKYKGNNRINFSYLNNGNKFYIKANESNREEVIINELVELGDINFNFKETKFNYIPKSMSLFLIMPIMGNNKDGDFNFQFGKTLFERMLNTISQKEVPVYYNKISSSYIVPIDSKDVIFDKPKSIIKKVEVKKEVKAVAPKPKKVAETPKIDAEKLELDEAIETLNLLLETLPKEEHKEIKEAIEILEMLK